MAILTAKLLQSKDLQQYFVDKDTGLPLAGGVVRLYQDENRTVLKNWYYQSGTPGSYEYITLPNPLTLSAVGTVQDVNENDVLPLYYPLDETDNATQQLYYITISDPDISPGIPGELQFTRAGFPFVPPGSNTPGSTTVVRNYIVNNNLWRNSGFTNAAGIPVSIDVSSQTNLIVAPSQHDGFSMGDVRFIKNNTSATDLLTFKKFDLGDNALSDDITPEFYINHQCTAAGASESLKVYQWPISLHVNTLDSIDVTVTLQTQAGDESANNLLKLYMYQFLGTGVTSPAPVQIQTTIILDGSWTKAVYTFTTPTTEGLTLSSVGDDALYLQVALPLDQTCNVNFTLPSLYIGSVAAKNEFNTYDQWDAIINSPRTGDYRHSLNNFYPYGWVPANDGTIGSYASNATTRANYDTWQLYNLIWGSTLAFWAPMADSSPRGASAYIDFTANRAMYLTRNLGRVLQGLNAVVTPSPFTTNFAGMGKVPYTLTFSAPLTVALTIGTPLQLTTTSSFSGGLSADTVYYVSAIGTNAVAPTVNSISLANTLDDAYAGINTVQIVTSDGTGQSILNALGAYIGQSGTTDVVEHTHDAPFGINVLQSTGSIYEAQFGSNDLGTYNGPTGPVTGGGVESMSLLQPTVNVNVFLKL